jgi:hypothetical protein
MKSINSKPFWKSRTMWLGMATLGLSILEFTKTLDLPVGVYGLIGIGIIVLRYFTSKPVTLN